MNECLDSFQCGEIRIEICQGDITEESVDAIVNAANADLQHGGGVAGAIVRKGGMVINQESADWISKHGRVGHKHPAYTSAGALPSNLVIHTVGPIWGEGNEDLKLADAVIGALDLATRLKCQSIAFPAISTGIYGFPKERAARIILSNQLKWCQQNDQQSTSVKLIRNVLWGDSNTVLFANTLHELTS